MRVNNGASIWMSPRHTQIVAERRFDRSVIAAGDHSRSRARPGD